MTWQLDDPLGWAPCPACKRQVMYAWDDDMETACLEPDDSGEIAVSLDGNRLPWCRLTAGTQLAFDETLYRLHDPVCPAPLAPLVDLAGRRPAPRPAPVRRQANAR